MSTDQLLADLKTLDPTSGPVLVPRYLQDHYHWAYLSPLGLKIFDHPVVVSAILWGNYHRLIRAALQEIEPGMRVLQTACVYGDFSRYLAEVIGPGGSLNVIDAAEVQVDLCRRKLAPYETAVVQVADAVTPPEGPFDRVVCFFLLHEVPDDYKRRIVDAVLDRVGPQGKAVFVDYHQPGRLHPLRPVMQLVFQLLEPFATALWHKDIETYAARRELFSWSKATYFGGLYQKTVATRLAPAD